MLKYLALTQHACTLWRGRVHLRTGFHNPFLCHDSGISAQIFQLYISHLYVVQCTINNGIAGVTSLPLFVHNVVTMVNNCANLYLFSCMQEREHQLGPIS